MHFYLYQPFYESKWITAYLDGWFRSKKAALRSAKEDMELLSTSGNFKFKLDQRKCSFWQWLTKEPS